jgi:hypothetical protein
MRFDMTQVRDAMEIGRMFGVIFMFDVKVIDKV